ncbi:hypothetical protein [Lacrimispora amygdalina]|uniref:hypothetical protein n=1 Tax=Lacrimispora amygdalina TaxID=253257 RepID=UPI000BE2C6FD|nr:hypothetical protein [Lacrimispora amygdalina]
MSRLWNIIFGWEEILVTDDIDKYMKLKAELTNKGIITRTEFVNNQRSHRGTGSMGNVSMYYLYMKKNKK